jgi:hypothetical protein
VTVAGNTYNFSLLASLGFVPSVSVAVTLTINAGVTIGSVVAGSPAMDLSGLPAGSTVNLINNGYIIGKGGDGANGAMANYPGSGATIIDANLARAGGNAIVGPGTGRTFNITNANGRIWGGGGGGGGGGAYDGGGGGNGTGNAGGGGGGAGGGRGGDGGLLGGSGDMRGGNGVDGSVGPAGVGGTPGSGAQYGTGTTGASGAGGTYGVDGTTGAAPGGTTPAGHTALFSAGGTAGKAIELLGASAPTFLSGNGAPNVLGLVS